MVVPVLFVLGAFVLLAGSAVYFATRQNDALPGKLENVGRYDAEIDLNAENVRVERERDFCRICESQTFLHYATVTQGKVSELRLLELKKSTDFQGYIRQINTRYFDSCILSSYAYALVSATTPFEFAMHFQVPPNFSSNEFVLMHDASTKSLRVLWGTFYQDYFIVLLSDPLLLKEEHNNSAVIKTQFSYFL